MGLFLAVVDIWPVSGPEVFHGPLVEEAVMVRQLAGLDGSAMVADRAPARQIDGPLEAGGADQ